MKRFAIACAAALASDASAVSLSQDGMGQALIFPYYTTNASRGDAFNTYLSIVNHTAQAKALRVRFREGRASQPVLDFNLFLAPNDVWSGAVVPNASGAQLLASDSSCTDPVFTSGASSAASLPFTTAAFTDGAGTDSERVREGFVEVLEMAELTGASATAATHNSTGLPANCALLLGNAAPSLQAPAGGLSGTLTLINVASGMDFTVNAEALAGLASRPYFRLPDDRYPDFNAAEIDAVSEVSANGQTLRSRWNRPADAVSAVLMRTTSMGEFVLDANTRSLTDFVMTFPTRHFYASGLPPFAPAISSNYCRFPALGNVQAEYFNREASGALITVQTLPLLESPEGILCGSAVVFSVRSSVVHIPPTSNISQVLGSANVGFFGTAFQVPRAASNGWIRVTAPTNSIMDSLATSMRWASGSADAPVAGAHRYMGLPVVGFTVRTFRNDAVSCQSGTCQGNYGGAFPLKFQRSVSPAP